MKGNIYCHRCIEDGRRPQVLGKYEDIRGGGHLYLWCKKCRKEIHIDLGSIRVEDE